MTQNQVAYRNMLVNQQNAESNRIQAEASKLQAETAKQDLKRRRSESWIEGITSGIANIGGLMLGLLL